jgi:hypothetical protein
MTYARIITTALMAILATASSTMAAEWHVGPMGAAGNKGAKDSPWDLRSVTAAEHNEVQPGDTVWLGLGTYSIAPPTAKGWERAYVCTLSGAPEKPIIFRATPGERVTIDGAISLQCNDVWFWGIQLTTSTPRPVDPDAPNDRPEGGFVTYKGSRCKFINCVLTNNNMGISWWVDAEDAETYGCIFEHNGWKGAAHSPGHDIYTQNLKGVKRIVDNIFWGGYGYGLHCYGSDRAFVNGYHIEGNILFSKGIDATPDGNTNTVVGSGNPSHNITFINNISYMPPTSNRVNTSLYYQRQPSVDLVCKDNYFAGGRFALVLGCWEKISGSGNTFFARSLVSMQPLDKLDPKRRGEYSWDNNEYIAGTWPKPFDIGWSVLEDTVDFKGWQTRTGLDKNSKWEETAWHAARGVKVFVRPNKYEPGRAHIAVLNWDRAQAMAVDLSGVLKQGQPYRIFNVQKLWDAPVAWGTYDGKPVAVPTLLSWTAPEMDAYLVLPTANGDAR